MPRPSNNRFKVSNHVSIEQKPNGFYYAIIDRSGKSPLERSLRTKNRDDAIARVKNDTLEAVAAHNYTNTLTQDVITRLQTGYKIALGEAATKAVGAMELEGKKFTTYYTANCVLKQFLRAEKLESEPLSALEPRHIDHFINKVMIKKRLATRRRAFWVLDYFCSWMMNEGLRPSNPTSRISIKTEGVEQELLLPKERKPFTLDELDRLIAACDKGSFWWCAIQIVMETGLRLSDVAGMQWASIRGDHFEVVTGKRGIKVKHPITPRLREVFVNVKPLTPEEEPYLFPDVYSHHEASQTWLSKQFSRLCEKCGIEDKSFHGLRHTYALRKQIENESGLRKRLMDEIVAELALRQTQEQMGHGSVESTKHYLNHAQR